MNSVPWGGSEVLWSSAAKRLVSEGHQVVAAYQQWPAMPKPLQEMVVDFGVAVWECGPTVSLAERLARKLIPEIRIVQKRTAERDWLVATKPDLLCISSGNATEGADWMQLALDAGVPFVTVAQAHVEFLWPEDGKAEWLIKLFAAAKKCFFVSQGNLNLLQTQLATTLGNAEVVSNHGTKLWNSELRWPEPVDGIWRLACVGRLHPSSKGQDLLISVLQRPQWRDRLLEISFYGEGPQEASLKRLVVNAGLRHKLHFRGHVTDVEQIWRDNHALVLPSRYEGLPLALVEALMCGRTAIVTDVAGNAEVLEHGVTGFVAEAATETHLARAMEDAWAQKESWQEMGRRAREFVHRRLPADPAAVFAGKLIELAGKR